MVKKIIKIFLPAVICCILLYGCDLFDIFTTPDLAERLRESDNFVFLTDEDRNPSFGDNYSFIVISDIHIAHGNTRGIEKLQDVIDNHGNIKFIVFLGDITDRGERQDLEAFINIAKNLSVPCYPVFGNHEIMKGSNWSVWKELIGSTRYRIDGDTVTLFVLDSANSYIGKVQMDWLDREIKTNTRERVFVFTHENYFATEPFSIEHTMSINERARMVNILHNKCDMMFMGHIHKRAVNKAGSVTYISVDCYRDTKNYILINVAAAGITYQFKNINN